MSIHDDDDDDDIYGLVLLIAGIYRNPQAVVH